MNPMAYLRALIDAAKADWVTSTVIVGMAIFLTIGVIIK